MWQLVYSDHAKKRMKQRGLTELEIEYVFEFPECIRKSFEGRKEATATIRNRRIHVEFVERDNYIRIITIM